MSIAHSMLAELHHEAVTTRRYLEIVPFDRADYRPHAKSMALVPLASHIAEMLIWGAVTVKESGFDMDPNYKPWVASSREELLGMFDKSLADFSEALGSSTATDEHMMKPWTLSRSGTAIFSMPRAVTLRSMIFNHIVHHRAQLGVYLRLLDIPLPKVYGPSADEV